MGGAGVTLSFAGYSEACEQEGEMVYKQTETGRLPV